MAEPEDLYVVGPNPHIPWGTPTNVFALGRMADFTYLGMEPGQIPMPELDFAPWVIKVLKLVHPNVELSQEGLLTMEDIMHASLAMIVRAAAEVPHTDIKTVEAEHQVQVYSERTVVGTRQYLVHGNDNVLPGDSRAWVSDHEVIDPRVRAAIETWRGLSPEDKRERQKDFFAQVAKAEEVAGGPEADQPRLSSLTPVCVKAAVGLVLPDELSKHAVSEGTKAVTKGITGGLRNVSEAQQKCALQFGPATVGALAAHLSGCHVTLFAACFLAAVLEYLAAEVMELAGNAARDCQRRFITNRHIFLAISNDAELVALYSTSIFKGGVLPIIHLSLSDAKGIPSAAALLAEGDLNPGADLGEDKAVQDRAMATLLAAPCHESVTADDDRGDGPETHYAHVFADYRAMPDDVTAETERRGFGGLMAEEPLEYAPDVTPSGVSDRPDSMRRDGGSGGEEPFTRHQLRALAAKAGIVAIDIEALNATKDALMEYVRSRVRAVLTRAEQRCRGGPVAYVDLADLAGSFERLHFGTGRLGKSHKRSLMRPSAAAPHYAFWEKAAAVDRTEGVDFLADYLMTVVDAAEDEGPPEMEGPDEEDPNNFEAQYRRSLRFVRHMQNSCENVIPYRAFASVVSKIARDFKKCFMTPGCICVLSYFTQDFMVRLLQEACLAAIHRKAYVVTEKDVKIASKCHRENATLVSP